MQDFAGCEPSGLLKSTCSASQVFDRWLLGLWLFVGSECQCGGQNLSSALDKSGLEYLQLKPHLQKTTESICQGNSTGK